LNSSPASCSCCLIHIGTKDPLQHVTAVVSLWDGLNQILREFRAEKSLQLNFLHLTPKQLAKVMKIPVITTTSEPSGTNGPLMSKIHQTAPHAVYVPRKGAVNALGNEDFVKTIRATGRKTLIMAGVWTDVCVMFPALDARWQGSRCTP
jgi:hypothetical protein